MKTIEEVIVDMDCAFSRKDGPCLISEIEWQTLKLAVLGTTTNSARDEIALCTCIGVSCDFRYTSKGPHCGSVSGCHKSTSPIARTWLP